MCNFGCAGGKALDLGSWKSVVEAPLGASQEGGKCRAVALAEKQKLVSIE